jgi:hypothetical protein
MKVLAYEQHHWDRMFGALHTAGLAPDHAEVQRKIEEVVRQYRAGTPQPRQRHLAWKQIARQKASGNLAEQIAKLAIGESAADSERLSKLANELSWFQLRARHLAELHRPLSRFARMFSACCEVWVEAGGKLSILNSGPLPDFLYAALEPVCRRGYGAIRVHLGHEKRRREKLVRLERAAYLAGAGRMLVDATAVAL